MATTGAFYGKNLLLYLNGTAIALSRECTFSVSSDEIDITSKDSAFAYAMLPAQVKATVSFSGLATVAAGTTKNLLDAIQAGTKFAWKFSTNTSGDNYMHGTGLYITSMEVAGSVGDAATYSGSAVVTGTWDTSQKT